MDRNYLQDKILSKPYKREVWYSVLKEIFGIQKLNEPVKDIHAIISDPGNIVDKVYELGSFYTSDERLIGVYEIELLNDAKTKLSLNKVGLRNLLRSVFKYDVDGALIVFKQDLKWRFSYVSEIRTKEGTKETEPKRYTYLFGEGESCKTASDRFIKLQNKRLYLEDLSDAFSVEKLNEDFFRSYKGFFETFSEYIANENNYRKSILGSDIELEKGWKDDKAKSIRDFTKKLLGRMVFLQFLQKKGWIGVSTSINNWTGGNVKFLQTIFNNSIDKEHFHSKILKVLFFETLNLKRKDDVAPDILGENIRIPYLNGGLFDKDISYELNFDFPVEFFKNLLDFFEQYNFTIDENDPYDSEVGIDPEMLGHIFENLLEENREKGAFYTPKEIVHYMCQESLIEYLHTQLPNIQKEHIDTLVRNNKLEDDLTDYKIAQQLNDKLGCVKICDPAIGSGAFPMGLLKEIFDCRRLLYGYLKTNETFNPALVKKQIIQDNIYGVDKENGAVEIARLRFWLALVVDEIVPQPLPNLDYKIMQGDSLLERFRDIDLSNLADIDNQEDLFSSKIGQLEIGVDFSLKKQTLLTFDKESKEELYDCINEYYNYDETTSDRYKNKQEIKSNINNIVESKLLSKFNSKKKQILKQIDEKNQQIAGNESRQKDSQGLIAKKGNNIAKLLKEIEVRNKEISELIDVIDQLHELQTSNYKPYFLWHLWFKDVFDNNGFDIVIGNPPYIQLQKMGVEADILQQAKYETFTRSSDIYCLFFELGNKLLKPAGNLIYITSNSWLRANYGKVLRTYFTATVNPLKLIDLSDTNVFKSATVRTSIFQFKKEVNQKGLKAIRVTRKSQDHIKELDSYFEKNYVKLKLSGERAWVVHEKEKADIIQSVEIQGQPLNSWAIEINRGLITGFNDAFIIDESKRRELIERDPNSEKIIKPLLRGRDLEKYYVKYEHLYLINSHNGIKEKGIPRIDVLKDYPAIADHLKQFEKELRKRFDQGDHWTNLRNCTYIEDFDKPKILYPNMVKDISFTFDSKGYFTNQKSFFLIGEKMKYLIGVLNSTLFRYCFEEEFPEVQGNAREINKVVFEEIPIKYPQNNQETAITKIVDYLLYLYDKDNEPILSHTPNIRVAANLEEVLNMMVYELYFENHMIENRLDVIDILYSFLVEKEYNKKNILDFYLWLQQPDNPVRNRIIAVDIKSESFLSKINSAT
jgi:hypothetical protein